ncbi:MAG: hypothetical protein LQ342_001602 [Letrouitia transgressa]|nr:MAG: hypothetical protein LQ342_001602 [Letrouitia transgressa]
MSWFWRGFQSAIFYYVSCAPCTKIAYHRRRRKTAARSKAERQEIEEAGHLYRHPSPNSTNFYWEEEIVLGPGPPKRKKDREKRANNQVEERGLVSVSAGSRSGTGSSADTVVGSGSGSGAGMETIEEQASRRSGEGWNLQRYQREDELLWGFDSCDDGEVHQGGRYYIARNPGINDLHPPIVSTQPAHKSEMQWMLQPPPSAKVMEGKERANRSRSGSGGSSRRGAELALGKQIGGRLMEEKRRKAHAAGDPSPAMSRASTRESNISNKGQRHDREIPTRQSTESNKSSYSSINDKSKKRKHAAPPQPPPLFIPGTAVSSPAPAFLPPQRPPLHTIPSSTLQSPKPPNSPSTAEPHRQLSPKFTRPQLLTASSVSSLRALQEFVSPSSALNIRPLPSPSLNIGLPTPQDEEDGELDVPAVESYFPVKAEYVFPPSPGDDLGICRIRTMENEGGGGVLGRWSMDV